MAENEKDSLLDSGLTGAYLREQETKTEWYMGGRAALPKRGVAWWLSGLIVKSIHAAARWLSRRHANLA